MLFSEIIGQQEIKRKLIASVQEERIAHAQLFKGGEGVGGLALALAYAQYIDCENKTIYDSCGICSSCIKHKKLAHPDLHFVFPIIKPEKKNNVVCDDFVDKFRTAVSSNPYISVEDWYTQIAGDIKQGMIYANESSEILRKINLKTYESEYKIMIVWLPEKMNVTCANKLLKIIEEPPAKTLFLLVSNSPDEIIGTILSRTQHLSIPQLKNEEIKSSILKNYSEISEGDAMNIARIANGNYTLALALLEEKDEAKQNFERFTSVMRLAWQVGNKKDHASLKTLRKWADDMSVASVGRERQKKFLSYAQHMTRENYIMQLHENELNYLTTYESNFSIKFSPFIHENNVEDLMNEFALAERHIEQNVNAKMVFFDLALKLIMLLKKQAN